MKTTGILSVFLTTTTLVHGLPAIFNRRALPGVANLPIDIPGLGGAANGNGGLGALAGALGDIPGLDQLKAGLGGAAGGAGAAQDNKGVSSTYPFYLPVLTRR